MPRPPVYGAAPVVLPAVAPPPPPPTESGDSVRAVVRDSVVMGRSQPGISAVTPARRGSSLASWGAGIFMFVSFAALGAAIVANGQRGGLLELGRSAAAQGPRSEVTIDQAPAAIDDIFAPELMPLRPAAPLPAPHAATNAVKSRSTGSHKHPAPVVAVATETAAPPPAPPPPPPQPAVAPPSDGQDHEAQSLHEEADKELGVSQAMTKGK